MTRFSAAGSKMTPETITKVNWYYPLTTKFDHFFNSTLYLVLVLRSQVLD